MKKLLLVLTGALIFSNSFSQKWTEMMQDPSVNLYDIQKEFNEYWNHNDKSEKGRGYKVFKRWENFAAPRVYPSGKVSQLNLTTKNFQEFLSKNNSAKNKTHSIAAGTASWTAVGLFGSMQGTSYNGTAGCKYFVRIDPTNPNIMYSGGYANGAWKSTNGGSTWTTINEYLPLIGCYDVAIDPSNNNILYLATNGIGVYKSIDGGLTWNTTGLSTTIPNWNSILKILINPTNPQILLAISTAGFGSIQRSTDGGVTWTASLAQNIEDMEFKPGNPNVVYAAGKYGFYRSTDNGVSFSLITNGIPNTAIGNMVIAVTPADTNRVFALTCNNTNSGFGGVYLSTNGGTSFVSTVISPVNYLGYSTDGSSTGGQGWYDLCIAVSSINKDEVVIGGINLWRSTNAGASFNLFGYWITGGAPGVPGIHADQHDLYYDATGKLFCCSDGGVYNYSGGNFNDMNSNMNISQVYKIGLSSLTPNKWITGHQDNGTGIWDGTNYRFVIGGDGMDCQFDRTNDNTIFGSYQFGAFNKSTDGGFTWSSCTSGLTGGSGWTAPLHQDPIVANTMYVGYTDLFKSTNLAGSWSMLAPLPNTTNVITEFAVAPSNPLVIYVLKDSGVYKTTNGGASWTNVTGIIPVVSCNPTYVMVNPTDPNMVWVTVSGYSFGNKVFKSTNGGATWTNISNNLPNIPANCVVYQNLTQDKIYVGMDVGVYYLDNTTNIWTLFNTNLPNVVINELEISPAAPNTLIAATYGRGEYQIDITQNPVSSFAVPGGGFCSGQSVVFNDQSTNTPNSWNWTVSPNTGVTINTAASQNPTISFSNSGTYTVTLVASNLAGPGTPATQTININLTPTVSVAYNTQTVCVGSYVIFSASGATTYTWSDGGGNGNMVIYTPTASATYTVTGNGGNGCTNSAVASVVLDPCAGIQELQATENSIAVYPNPNNGNFTIETKTETQITLYSTNGSVVMEKKLKPGKNNLDISHHANGIYYLRAVTNNKTRVIKLVKED